MEQHFSSLVAKKFWNYLRIALFVLRRGLISKTKLFMDINLMLQRGKVAGKTLANLMFHHQHNHHHHSPVSSTPIGFFKFSCSNTPNPIVSAQKLKSIRFPCIHATSTTGQRCRTPGPVVVEIIQELSAHAAGERHTPLCSSFSARASNYSDEKEGSVLGGVDVDAEEFIKLFYEQLREESPTALPWSPERFTGSTKLASTACTHTEL